MLDNSTTPEPAFIAWRNVGGPVHRERNVLGTTLEMTMKPIHSAEPVRSPIPDPGFDADVIIEAARQAVREGLARHEAKGDSVVVRRDGRVTLLEPEQIEL